MRSELSGLNGGSKQFWLRTHRKEVEAYYFERGAEATMAEYNMVQATLERFLQRKGREERITRLSQADKSVMEYSRQGIAEVRGRIRDLEDWRAQVSPVIELGQAFLNATMQSVKAKVDDTPLSENALSLMQLSGKSK
jgi:hypothetical protein